MLVIRRIHVRYRLIATAEQEPIAARVHAVHARGCPVYRSISSCIDITTELATVQGSQ